MDEIEEYFMKLHSQERYDICQGEGEYNPTLNKIEKVAKKLLIALIAMIVVFFIFFGLMYLAVKFADAV
ncbi:MAG: hypothetical protein GWN64_07790 [Candidatus Thorarchaeota archaeon]|nr:hypothetical protein [Candidatus Thorarchaeota archaeon]